MGGGSEPAEVKGPLSGETILLAQTTNDLYDEREQVQAYLQQFGAKVLPEGDYVQGGAAFASGSQGRSREERPLRAAPRPVPVEPTA